VVTGELLGSADLGEPKWSPDGERLAFAGVGSTDLGAYIYTQALTSSSATEVTFDSESAPFDWIDNDTLLYVPTVVSIQEIGANTGSAVPSTVDLDFIGGGLIYLDIYNPAAVPATPALTPTPTPTPT